MIQIEIDTLTYEGDGTQKEENERASEWMIRLKYVGEEARMNRIQLLDKE